MSVLFHVLFYLVFVFVQLKRLPEHVVVETSAYINLKSQFSVLFKEAQEMKLQLEESRGLIQKTKNAHLRQIEQMEVIYRKPEEPA